MSTHWQNIMSSPEFQAMTPEKKQTTRDVFFDEVIAKQEQDPEVLREARNYFNEQFNFIPKTEEPKTTATGAFLKAAKHEAGAGVLGGLGAALGAAGMGAITGAEAGSVVPGWGNLAGAVIGGLVGGFGGKKWQQYIQGKESYEQEARELEQLSQEHPIATSTGGLLPVIPTMMLNPGAGAATRLAGIGDEVSNIAAQAIRKNAPELTDDLVNVAAEKLRLMKPADAVNYAKSLGLGDEAVQAVQNAATKTVPRYVGQGLESGVQMGVASGASSAAQVAEGSKDFSDIPADILKGAVTGAPLGLVSPVRFGKGRLGAGLGGALVKGPLDAALMATGEEAYDAATGHSDGFDLQRTGERALGMLPSFSLLAGGMGVFHGVPGKLKEPAKPGQPELPYDQLPPVAEEIKIKEHEAIQNYIKAKASGDSDEITRAQEALIDARKAATPEPSILEKAAKQAEPVASPVLVEALKQADANIEAQKIEQAAKTQEVENAQVTDAETVLQGQPKGTEGRDTGLERMEPSPINQETKEPEPQEFRQEEAVTPVEPTSPPVERPLSRGETELLPEAPHEDRPAAVADTISPSIVESNADFTTKEPSLKPSEQVNNIPDEIVAARKTLEDSTKEYDEWHKPIPITEADPARIDEIMAKRTETSSRLEAAKANLRFNIIKHETRNLPPEQRTRQMEGIKDEDADLIKAHKRAVEDAIAQRKPVSLEAAKEYGVKLDQDYQADAFGIARPTLDSRIRPFKEYAARAGRTEEKVSSNQVNEAIKLLPRSLQKMLKKSGVVILTKEEAMRIPGAAEFVEKYSPEGFFYNGKIHVIPENIVVTTNDVNPVKAAARVLIHENFHEAFNAITAKDPVAKAEWESILKRIPENDLEALAKDYLKPENWRRNPDDVADLVNEWLPKKWEDYHLGKMAEAERPIFDRILESISKIIKRMFGNVRQFKTQDEDLEALFDRLTKNRLKITDEKANQEKLRLSTRGDDESESARARLRLRSEVARISQASLRSMGISDDMLAKFNIRILRDGEREREGFGPVSAGVTKDGRVAISFDFRNLDSQMPMGIKDSPQAREKFVKDAINEELIHLSDLIGFRNEWQKEGGVGSLNEFINKRSNIRFSIPTSPEAERERQFGKNLFGISMEAMRQQSKQFETGEMERVRLDYGEELFNRVRRAMDKDPRLGERATDRVLSGEGGLPTQDEQVAMALETAKLTNQLNTLGDLLDSPGMPTSEYSDILNRIDAIKGNMNRTMQAIYQSGTALSRAFYARQLAFNNKYELQNIYQRARRAKGGVELSKEEYEHIFNQTRRIIKDTDALDRLEREKDKLRVTDLIDLVAKQVDEIKNSGGKIGDEGKIVLKETPPPSKEQAAIDVTEEVINDVSQKAVGKLDSIFGRFSSIFSAIKKRGLKIAEKFGFKPSLAEDEFSKLSDDELLKLADETSKDLNQAIKNVQAVLGINEPKTGDNQTKAKSVLDEARKKIEQLKEPLIKDKKPRPKTKLQELLKEHHDLRMSADEFLKKAEDIGLDGKTATELYENYNNRKGAYAQELPDSVFTRLLRKFVEEGERDTNQIAVKISQWLGKSGYGDISPEDVMARVSRYGKKTFPSQEEVDKISRQKTAEMLVLSQINDIEENLRAPQLTGAQRDKAHAELRELMKRRNDIMNELDIHRVSPEQQFANARDRSIRALENRKEELLRVLEGKAEYRQKTRKTRERDAEEQALYDEVQSLNKQVLELYKEDKPLTPEEWNAEREKRLNASINKLAERIKNKDFLPKEMTPVEKTQAVKDAEALLQQLREDFMEMRDAAHPELKIEAKQKAVTKALQNRLEALRKIEETGRETKEKSDLPDTPEMKAIREAIKELSQKIKIKEWPEKRMESLQKALDRADKAIEGNLPGVKTPKFEHLKTAEIREAEELLRNKRYTRTLQAQLRKWNEKLASGDFTHKKKSVRVLDEQQRAIKSRIDKVKDDIDKAVKELEYNQLSPLEKAGEWAVRLKRFNILSSPISVFKLSSAAMIRAGTMSMENFMKTPLDILYPEIAKYGSLEAGSSSKELGKAIATAWSKGMKDSYETLQKGKSELDRLYGDGSLEKEGWTNFFGRMHGMLKAPVKRAAFELAMTRQIEAFRREKGYIPSEAEQLPLAMRAYAWANRQIFMNDNAITSAWNSALNTFDQKGWRGASNLARFLLPIVKVPTNIAIETAQYTPMGLAKGTYDMIKVVRAGIDSIKDKPEMVESIQRNFRKGAIGTGLMLLGYALPQIAGGFYEKGEKRHKDEADFGELMINGVRVPKWMIHAPFFEVIQLGSTMRRAIDHSLEKHGEREYSEGVIAGLKGVADELPFISEMGRVSDAMDNAKSRNRFLGDLVASSVVPAAVGYVARKTDTEAPDDASIFEKLNAPTVKRETVADSFPKTARQSIQAQIPGLRERLVPRSTTPFGPGIAIPSAISLYEKSGHPMPSLPLRSEFETRYGKVSDDRWLSYVAARGNMLRREMMDKMHQLNEMDEADKRKAVQQITKHASSSARKMIGLE